MTAPAIRGHRYVLAVRDVRASAAFYVEALGFEIVAEPPGWIFLRRDACTLMLGECPDDLPARDLGSHSYFAYLEVDDAEAWHARLTARGVEVVHAIRDEPWGMREMGIRTPDGHRIMLGQAIAGH